MNTMKMNDPRAIVAILLAVLTFFVIGYFIEKFRRRSAESLNARYHLRWHEIDKLVNDYHWHWDATSTLHDKIGYLLTQKANADSELSSIDQLLKGRRALDSKKSRYDKIAFSLAMNMAAAQGAKVSNRAEDYQ